MTDLYPSPAFIKRRFVMSRLFRENGFTTGEGITLPLSEFRLFSDLSRGAVIDERYHKKIIESAEPLLDKEYSVLRATDYMAYKRTGDRSAAGARYNPRRADLMILVSAELVEGEGRFMDAICNLIWMILEESTWVVNAHNRSPEPLSPEYDDTVENLDLFAATTGATLAFAYCALKDKLDKITPIFSGRLLMMLRRRVINPFINAPSSPVNWWTGTGDRVPNNWNPWICSNALFVAAAVEEKDSVREEVVTQALLYLDNFIAGYAPDGGCDEGPGYWNAAGGALMDCLQILFDMTGGKINIYHEPLLKNIVEYIAKFYVANGYYLNYADGAPRPSYSKELLATFARATKSELLYSFALSREPWSNFASHHQPYRGYRMLCTPTFESKESKAPLKVFFPDLQVATTRESEVAEEGLYIALKGGNNAESHNHNDLGSITVYSNGEPLFLDAGSGIYTKRTFSGERYSIWTMCSDYHNTLNFGDTTQKPGEEYRAEVKDYDERSGKLTLDLKNAYPKESGVLSYERSASLDCGVITVNDSFTLEESLPVYFCLMTRKMPESVSAGEFVLEGRRVKFDNSLSYSCEAVMCDTPETVDIPKRWKCENIFRIKLSSKPIKTGSFTLTVE